MLTPSLLDRKRKLLITFSISYNGWVLLILYFGLCNDALADCQPWFAKAVSVQGLVSVIHEAQSTWEPVRLYDTFCQGDSIRVGERSRAAILMQNQTLLRLDEDSTATFTKPETKESTLLEIIKGAIHFISRTPQSMRVETPFVNAGIEGTEFTVRVTTAQTSVWVLEGKVKTSNFLGALTLTSGEAAVAKKGYSPEKRIVVKPREAVQWALYYPPVIDYRSEHLLREPTQKLLTRR